VHRRPRSRWTPTRTAHSGLSWPPELRTLLRSFSSTPVLAALSARSRLADLRTLGAWGVAEVISVEQDDAAAIALLLRSVRGRPLQSLLERALPE